MRRIPVLLLPFLLLAHARPASPDDEVRSYDVRVVDSTGEAVEGAAIFVHDTRVLGQSIRPVYSDPTGKARLRDLDARRQYQLDVNAPSSREDLSNARVRDWIPEVGTVITLSPGRTIRGTVVDSKGQPASGTVWYETHQGSSGGNSTFGGFELRGLPRAPIDLVATARGVDLPWRNELRESAPWVRVPVGTSNVRLTLWTDVPEEKRRRLRVLVTGPDGVIPARVKVEAGYWSAHTTTYVRHGRGEIDLEEQSGKAAFVRAFAASDADGKPLPWAPARMDVPFGQSQVHVEMPLGVEVSGHVRDEAGIPQGGLRILATDRRGIVSTTFGALAETGSAADGSFRLVGLGEGEIQIGSLKSRNWPASVPVQCRGGDEDVVIVVRKASSVEVTIIDERGRPVVGASCVVWQWWHTKSGGGGQSLARSETDAEGKAVLPPIDPGLPLKLEVEVPSSRDDLAPLSIVPWVPASETLTMPRGFTATIRVVDDDGRPVKAVVRKRLVTPNPPFDGGGWSSVPLLDEAGKVIVRGLLEADVHEFKAIPAVESKVFPGCSPWVRATPSKPEIVLRIPTRGHRMTVRAAGARPGQIGLLFSKASGSPTASCPKLEFGDDGVAHLDNVGAGEYSILVLAAGPDQAEYKSGCIPSFQFAGGEVEVKLAPKTQLRVRGISESATEVVGVVELPDGSPLQLQAREDGELWTDLLPEGRYPVLIYAETGSGYLRGQAWARTGETTEIELRPGD